MRRQRLIFLSGLFAAMALLATARPANAFYWYGWPGGKLPPPPTILPPPNGGPPGNPPDNPPPDQPPDTTPPTNPTPEPATALAALIGIGALAARKAWQRKK